MAAYYNEIDPFAAEQLRQLIRHWLIADGEVDGRSIEQVEPADLRGFSQCHFFAGIGVWSYALRLAGWPDDRPVWTGSCPCQPFSVVGKRKGAADERHLWPAWFRLIDACRPPVIFGEQVASAGVLGKVDGSGAAEDGPVWFDAVSADLERAQYTVGALDIPAAAFGAPHLRAREWILAYPSGYRKPEDGTIFAGRSKPDVCSWWNTEPAVARMVNGTAGRMDRIRVNAMGRMAVPQIAQWIGERILAATRE